jgi:hypothetical protein
LGVTVAPFYYHQYQVSFVVSPSGSGTINPSGTNVWETAGVLSISASYNSGYRFSSWSATGSITITSASSASTTATISGTGTITATFTQNAPAGTFGYTTQGSSTTNGNLEDYILGTRFQTPGYGVTAQSITAYIIASSSTTAHTVQAAIYTSGGAYVAGTQEVSVTSNNDGWVVINFATGSQPTLTAGTNYYLVVWSNTASGSMTLYSANTGGNSVYDGRTYTTWPATDAWDGTLTNIYSIYCTYSLP